MDSIEKLLAEAARDFRLATENKGRGDNEAARRGYLQAAEKLMLTAGRSRGTLQENRKRLAQELITEAGSLKSISRRSTSGTSSGHSISSGDDEQAATWLVSERPNVTFADVAGLEEVKEQIRLKLLYPFSHPDYALKYGIQPGGGILLFGPPGTGKTLMARAVAGEMEATFFAIKPSEIMSQWVGVAEQNFSRLFAEASTYPLSVIFIDELEALAPKRRTSISTVMQRVVPQLLAELDGFEKRENTLLFVGATNEPWAIDSAILRPGRLDRLIYIPPPDLPARIKILELNLKNAPLEDNISLEQVAARAERFSGADMAALARRVREQVFFEAIHQGVARQITSADFDDVLREMRPSISSKDLELFEHFSITGEVLSGRRH